MARWLLVALLVCVAGCPPQRRGIAPADERQALQRVNDNLAKIEQPLQYQATVSFRFRDANGTDRRFIGHAASLVFYQPRSLRFDIRSLAGEVAQFGSVEDRYWLWIEPEVRKLWWGYWEMLEQANGHQLAVPPDDLLDALMLRPLPATLTGNLKPLLRLEDDDHRLLFVRLGADGQPSGVREIRLDPSEPYQPLEIVDRLPDGRVQMHAHLSSYKRIGEDGPFTARRYEVYWPLDRAEMRLDVKRAQFRPELRGVIEFPANWQGDVEQLDALSDSFSTIFEE
ncbi:MAG: hypothetical protein ABIG44_05490 [Planctomycetota bacterium]